MVLKSEGRGVGADRTVRDSLGTYCPDFYSPVLPHGGVVVPLAKLGKHCQESSGWSGRTARSVRQYRAVSPRGGPLGPPRRSQNLLEVLASVHPELVPGSEWLTRTNSTKGVINTIHKLKEKKQANNTYINKGP